MMPYRLQLATQALRRHAATLRGMVHLDNHDLRGTVLLAGSGRSGTTWLGQIINHTHPYRDIFEPLHPGRIKRLSGWPVMRYLPSDDNAADTIAQQQANAQDGELLRDMLAGKFRSRWTDAYNRKSLAKQRLIKVIRANLLLGWIHQHCPEVKLLLAMRHPCAVVHSRVKLGWDTHLDELLAQPQLMRDHLEPYRETIERAERSNDPWLRHLTMWCIENAVPLRQLKPGQAHVLFYERFCESFQSETADLFRFLDRPVPPGIENMQRQHSAHFRRDSAILRGGDLISDWQRHVGTKQINQTLSSLKTFGLDHLYDDRPAPKCKRDDIFTSSRLTADHAPLHRDAA